MTTYYVAASGSDSAAGMSPATAWKTIGKANGGTYAAGDSVLFNGGDSFTGQILFPGGSGGGSNPGTTATPITVGSYGTGRATILNPSGHGIIVNNVGGYIIRDLVVTGSGGQTSGYFGIYFFSTSATQLPSVQVINCAVTAWRRGIEFSASTTTGGWTGITVDTCDVSSNGRNGIYFAGGAAAGSYNFFTVLVNNCTVNGNLGIADGSENGDGILLQQVSSGTVQFCTATGNGANCNSSPAGPAGIWTSASTGVTIQNCVAYSNQTGPGAGDGAGFDIDVDCTNCVIQYCIAYGNDAAGFEMFGGAASTHSGNTIRYCLAWGNCQQNTVPFYGDISLAQGCKNDSVYGCTVVSRDLGSNHPSPLAIYSQSTGNTVRNNIFHAQTGFCVNVNNAEPTSDVLLQGNDYWNTAGTPAVNWNGTTYTTLAALRAGTSQEIRSGPTISAVGTAASATASGLTTLAVSPTAVGDCLVLMTSISSLTITANTVAGGGCTWVKIPGASYSDGTSRRYEMWVGTVTATGASTITVTWSSSNAGLGTDLAAQQFHSTVSGPWTATAAGTRDNTSSATVTFPTLTPSSGLTELYVGRALCPSAGSYSGTTAGYTEQTDADTNPVIYKTNVSAAASPTTTANVATVSHAIAALISSGATGLMADPAFTAAASTPAVTSPVNLVPAQGLTFTAASPCAASGLDLSGLFSVSPGPVDFFGAALTTPLPVGAAMPVPVASPVTMNATLALTAGITAQLLPAMTATLGVTCAPAAVLTAGAPPPFPAALLALKIEILVNGTWTDITRYVYIRDGVTITRGRPDEATTVGPSTATLTLNNRDGRFSPRNPAGQYYPFTGRNTQLRISTQSTPVLSSYTYRFWGEISAWPPQWDLSGHDVYVQVTASGLLRRMSQGSSLGSALSRYYTRLTGALAPAAYWPCEDGSAAAFLAPAAAGSNAMTFTGSPSLAADTTFGGSDPLPQLNSSIWDGTTNSFGSSGDDVYQTPGTYTWVCPGGTTSVDVRCWGGGGSGAGGTSNGGGGGGGGELAEETAYTVAAGNSYQVVVGAGGTAGGTGGTSSFDGHVIAHGGLGTSTGSGAAGGSGSSNAVHHGGGGGAAGSSGSSGSASFTTAGDATWTAPVAVTTVTAQCWGAGGGGQAGNSTAGNGRPAGGGGEFAQQACAVTPGTVYSLHVGTGGAGGTSNSADGADGEDTTFTGDAVTVTGHGGKAGAAGNGGNGGSGSTNTIHHSGGGGGSEIASGTPHDGGGGGGGSGGYTSTGRNGGNAPAGGGGGNGASAVSGGGGGGDGGNDNGKWGKLGGSPGGGGGGGAATLTGFGHGGGGYRGKVVLTWASSGAGGGGGGGGASGGTAATGTTAAGQPGGAAVTNGGPGGNGGLASDGAVPFNGPGGGGGGGDGTTSPPNYAGANGYPGQAEIIYAPSAVPNSNILRFLLAIPAASQPPEGAVIISMTGGGTVHRADLVYHTGGFLQLLGYNSGGTQIFNSGLKSFTANGTPMMVSIELAASGSNVAWTLAAITIGGAAVTGSYTGTVTGSMGSVTDVKVNPAGTITDTAIGHITVQYAAAPLTSVSPAVGGYAGELAGNRFTRLLAEESLTGVITGAAGDTAAMGPQSDATLLTLLQECEDADGGQIYETRDQFALAYRTHTDMTGQDPAVTLDYSLAQVSPPLAPTEDDQMTRNDVTVTRVNGASAQTQLDTGALSVLDPPAGVGRYTYATTINCYDDTQLAAAAARILAVGTVNEERYPVITVNLAHPGMGTVFAGVTALDAGDFLQIINPPPWLPQGQINQLAFGFTETLNVRTWLIAVNCVPESPYG